MIYISCMFCVLCCDYVLGDVTPQSVEGRTVAAAAALGGILCIAVPVSVIGTNFTNVYNENRTKVKKYLITKKKILHRFNAMKIKSMRSFRHLHEPAIRFPTMRQIFGRNEVKQIPQSLTANQREDSKKVFMIFDSDHSG